MSADTPEVRVPDERKSDCRPDVTETPSFQTWFSGSKVVDSNGEPQVVYHGTAADVTSFDQSKVGSKHVDVLRDLSDAGLDPTAFYFTNDPKTANWYAKNAAKRAGGANVVPVFLSLKNPLIVDFQGEGIEYLAEELERSKDGGYDGLIARNFDDGGIADHYVAFRPEQIKSAIGNNGNFDANAPLITHSRAAVAMALEHDQSVPWPLAFYSCLENEDEAPENHAPRPRCA